MTRRPESQDTRAVLARAYRALDEMQRKIDALERGRREPVAIVGMACRFPGGATDPERLWTLLRSGRDACVEIPSSRWDVDRYYDPDPDTPGTMYMRHANLLESVDGFDPAFFGISPREAQLMDPQQRMLLEVSWEALENAALAPARLTGTPTGVFVGISSSDYAHFQLRGEEYSRLEPHSGTGFAHSIVSGRIAYVLGLHGPALSVDTACSSSLVALHLACQSLRAGECRVALAAGVNVLLAPSGFILASKGRMLSPDGRCKTFDASADGYGRGEGCGVVVLKRLADAQADGDRILAVVRGTALNQDGRSGGLTVPSGAAQEAVVRLALEDAGIAPDQVGYVEAHGTGTSLGDPIEVQALAAALGRHRKADQPLLIGAVKANIGHLEAAAGMAGIIKLVLAMQHREIPPQPHVTRLNPYIPWDQLNVRVPTELTPWTTSGGPRIAGVNSFGFSGTNAHAVLEEAAAIQLPAVEDRPRHVLTISTRTADGLRTLAGRMAERLALIDDSQLADVCFTASTGRSHFAHRLAVPTASVAELRDALAAVVAGTIPAGVVQEHVKGARAPEVAFLFSGQGAQYVGMGRSLFETQPAFRRALERCHELLRPLMDRPLLSVLYPDRGATSSIDETGHTQPALFALEWALAELWRSWGVEPTAVMGHSIGELAAACVAGVFSLEDGLALVAARGRLMQALPDGAMAAVFAADSRVARHFDPAGLVSIAAINGPEHVTISGPVLEVDRILTALAADGISGRRLSVSHAFHSPAMDPMLDDFTRVAETVTYRAPRLALISNVTGQLAGDEVTHPAYWREHVRKPVRFADGMQALDRLGARVFVEIGPSSTLLAMARACVPEDSRTWLPSLRKGRDEWTQILDTLAALYGRGVNVDWVGFDGGVPRRRLSLPTYPFARDRHWLERPAATTRRTRRAGRPDDADIHPLVGSRVSSPLLTATVFESRVSVADLPFLGDHRFQDAAVFPAAAYVEAIRAASATVLGDEPLVLTELAFLEAMTLPDEGARVVQIALHRAGDGEIEFQLFSRAESTESSTWVQHVTGRVRRDLDGAAVTDEALAAAQARCQAGLDVAEYYARLEESGVRYGPAFQQIRLARRTSEEAVGLIEPTSTEDEGFAWHPAALDACFQMVGAVLLDRRDTGLEADLYMPVAVERMCIRRRTGVKLWAHARLRTITRRPVAGLVADVMIFDETGRAVAEVYGLEFRQVTHGSAVARGDTWVHEIQWEARPLAAPPPGAAMPGGRGQHWLVLADGGGLGDALAQELNASGGTCTVVKASHAVGAPSNGAGIDPYRPESFHKLLAGMPDDVSIIHCWGLDAAAERGPAPGAFRAADNPGCASALHLVQALSARSSARPRGLWVVTKGAQAVEPTEAALALAQAPLLGLGKTVALEHPTLGYCGVDLDPVEGMAEWTAALLPELLAPDGESQVAIRDGIRRVARLVARPARPTGAGPDDEAQMQYWTIPARGDLRDLACVRAPRRAPGPGEVEIRVRAAGINFRDVLNALGLLSEHAGPIGLECAGEVIRLGDGVQGFAPGDLVMGMASPSFASHVTTRAELVVPVPAALSAVEAATAPVAFLTAEYGLSDLAKLSAGESVLIHAAAGGVGLAAVQIAQRAGATVYATAGSPEKRTFLQRLGVQHVFDSRSLRFVDDIMACTEGRGVDVVLNSLNGEFIAASVSVLAPGGRFLEIGKRDIWDLPTMRQTRPDVAYWAYDLSRNLVEDPPLIPRLLRQIAQRLASGELRPLPSSVFPLDEATQAFRHMARARHIGKVVLTVGGTSATVSERRAGDLTLRPDATYLVSGGRGGIGLHLAEWLVGQGARRLALLGRTEPSAAAREALARMEQAGAHVVMAQVDVNEPDAVARIVDQLGRGGYPVRGVFHCAGVLDDGVLAQQSWERFVRVMTPKVDGAWNLHQATRHLSLDWFVLFSSASSLFGAAGQGNYAAGNAFLDALAHYRRAQGQPALSVNWGAWSGGGMATSLDREHRERWRRQGMGLIDPETGLRVLGRLMDGGPAQAAVLPITWSRFLETDSPLTRSPLLERLRAGRLELAPTGGRGNGAAPDWAERLRAAAPAGGLTVQRPHRRALDPARPRLAHGRGAAEPHREGPGDRGARRAAAPGFERHDAGRSGPGAGGGCSGGAGGASPARDGGG
jgi:acyl transferase domain-containing protein